jgi:hypothetical protein
MIRSDEDVIDLVVYYESIKREVKIISISECQCDERLKTKTEESTLLGYTGLIGELEHLKIKTRLIEEKFASVMGQVLLQPNKKRREPGEHIGFMVYY